MKDSATINLDSCHNALVAVKAGDGLCLILFSQAIGSLKNWYNLW